MVWTRLKQWLNKRGPSLESNPSELQAINWIEAADNPWGVPVLDVRPVTLGMISTTGDMRCAANAASYGNDDGTGFVGVAPGVPNVTSAALRYRVDRMLADGVLFTPREMEHKWAIYFHRGQIIIVRSWLRKVVVVADTEKLAGEVAITRLRGTFGAADEPPSLTVRTADYLLRSHALGLVYPAPLPSGMEADPQRAALWCFTLFGNKALYATPHQLPTAAADQPLRTRSLLHIAAARGDVRAAQTQIDAGVPLDLLAPDGLAPLHLSLVQNDAAMWLFLIERGSPVDVRSAEGATALMNAVQNRNLNQVTFLLNHGADPNATDSRGFTALHRAAELGELQIAETLLRAGASADPKAHGLTPRTLAQQHGYKAIAELLGGA